MSKSELPQYRGLEGKKIIIGITGGIASYKIADVVSALVQVGAHINVLMTESAARFITPLTFESLTGKPVFTSQWSHIDGYEPQHIQIANDTDAMLIAPCTMNMLAVLVNGMAHDPVSLVCSAIDRKHIPVLLAPSMNTTMLSQPATQRNLSLLAEDGFQILDEEHGWQACRAVGSGRMPEPETLLAALQSIFQT